MGTRELSPREEEVVALCIDGLTNDAIAGRLGLSIGTVNTYWLRIKSKVGGAGRTDTVLKVIAERAERAELAARQSEFEPGSAGVVDLRAALTLLQVVLNETEAMAWAADLDLTVVLRSNEQATEGRFGAKWWVGKSVFEWFGTREPADIGVAAHLAALDGRETLVRLGPEFDGRCLRVLPVFDERGMVTGCVSILRPYQFAYAT